MAGFEPATGWFCRPLVLTTRPHVHESMMGFEPMNCDFADHTLRPLGHILCSRGGIRTHTGLSAQRIFVPHSLLHEPST